ncbi:Acetyl esterase/lipase [Sporobacter termitidis DSM 10068]|uniref:Acetyl esterase/lipase n=1 Tax=Sporobacter termitidis DSM 10068 TaxID=1123282 RepID=A0A1M5UPK9_9FIRM|nr:alpha/beta hydrolase [Sporobacter termitidis]SHH64921.1 Acetyl esterase/lipase [Sporobacter termitidis DSM 10068]
MDSRVDPELRAMLSMMPREDFRKEDLNELRAGMATAFGPAVTNFPDCTVTDRRIPGPEGAAQVRVRLYDPAGPARNRPGVLYIHGGGYILGTPEMTDSSCAGIAAALGAVVASVDYRLAPEHPFPAPLEDCYAALAWFADNAPALDADRDNIAVVGGSAGGGLAAALALLARDRKGPRITFQAPLYPMLDDRNITPSSREFTDPRVWSRDKNIFAWESYLGPLYGGDVPQYAAPARALNLAGLPPAYTFVGALDLFRDETTDYVTRLLQAGVPTEFHIYPGCFHGFDMFPTEIGRRAAAGLIDALKRALVK